jgi:hypothetical protein
MSSFPAGDGVGFYDDDSSIASSSPRAFVSPGVFTDAQYGKDPTALAIVAC